MGHSGLTTGVCSVSWRENIDLTLTVGASRTEEQALRKGCIVSFRRGQKSVYSDSDGNKEQELEKQ